MINVAPVWEQGIFGNGVRVRVNDYGIDINHEEFQGRFDADASCVLHEARYNPEIEGVDQHGTIVASIIGASNNNNQCGTGIAPQVTLSSCIAAGENPDDTVYDNTWMGHKVDQMDISQNAYGFRHCRRGALSSTNGEFVDTGTCPFKFRPGITVVGGTEQNYTHPCDACEFPSDWLSVDCRRSISRHCYYHFDGDVEVCSELLSGLTQGGECSFLDQLDNTEASFDIGAQQGRDGKGVVYVFSAGNDFMHGGDTNYAGRYQSRYVIYAGAVGPNGKKTKYSRGGASLFVTAPAGDIETDFTYSVARGDGGCQTGLSGTSSSSAVVTGVVALILEANPDLTWRDVQGVLARTSKPVVQSKLIDETETFNGAGLYHSNLHGFGIVDAAAAVTRAQNWVSYGPEVQLTKISDAFEQTIGDDPSSPLVTEVVIQSEGATTVVENVVVSIWMKHLSRGHLEIKLISPDGTESILAPGLRPENGQGNDVEPWILRTVKSWGEMAEGTWKLSIADLVEGDVGQCADDGDWTLDGLGLTFDCAYLEYFPSFYDQSFQQFLVDLFDGGIVGGCCACGGGVTTNGVCADEVGLEAQCNTTVADGVCFDGGLDSSYQFFEQKSPSNGKSARESCCLLGGGVVHDDSNPFRDELIGWKIDIYGHEQVDTQSPTKSPSSIGVINPPSIDVTTAAPGNRGIGSSAKSLASSALLFVTVSVALLL
ncbi:MAG: hypothetical protein SGBAC_003124 [Bacillariaceae sp.]